MTDLTVIVPSRSRPASIERLARRFVETCEADTLLVVCIDADDPELPNYGAIDHEAYGYSLVVGERLRLGGTLNYQAPLEAGTTRALGFMGDDHLPVTGGWDRKILDALDKLGTGLAYGNDLNQGANLPTAVFMTSDIVATLGYMVPPGMTHLYLDNFWLELGNQVGITYLPDVIIEHLHPTVGKAPVDAGYIEVNAPEMYQADGRLFTEYMRGQLAIDVAKIKGH